MGDSEDRARDSFGRVVGDASISIRLRGLGLAGEYAWVIRCAKGFATGKGCRGRGVGGMMVLFTFAFSKRGGRTSIVGGKLSVALLTSGGESKRAGGRTGCTGSEA